MKHWGQDHEGMRPWASREEGRVLFCTGKSVSREGRCELRQALPKAAAVLPSASPTCAPQRAVGSDPPLTSQVASPTAPLIDWTQNDLLGLPSLGLKACHFYASNFFRVALGRLIRAELIVQVQRKAQGQKLLQQFTPNIKGWLKPKATERGERMDVRDE